MAEQSFILLERVGNGYAVIPTPGRDDAPVVHERWRVPTLPAPSGELVIHAGPVIDVDGTLLVVTSAAIKTLIPAMPPLPVTEQAYHGSTTATIRQMWTEVETNSLTSELEWVVHVQYANADPMTDFCDVVVAKEKNKGTTGANGEGRKEYVGHVTLLK